jgi:hypothetical protein
MHLSEKPSAREEEGEKQKHRKCNFQMTAKDDDDALCAKKVHFFVEKKLIF